MQKPIQKRVESHVIPMFNALVAPKPGTSLHTHATSGYLDKGEPIKSAIISFMGIEALKG